jgi:hypothetical protein
VGVVPKQDEQVSIVEGPDLQGDQLYQHLHDLSKNYRIDVGSGKLARK